MIKFIILADSVIYDPPPKQKFNSCFRFNFLAPKDVRNGASELIPFHFRPTHISLALSVPGQIWLIISRDEFIMMPKGAAGKRKQNIEQGHTP